MKIASWNVNGIRKRFTEAQAWIERERPDVVCLQELKASSDQVPAALCEMEGYRCYWHGGKGYSGVGLHVKLAAFRTPPVFSHPDFDYEHRIVVAQLDDLAVASVYVPNGGKDFPAKMRFVASLERHVAEALASGRRLVLCGDLNIARSEVDVHPKERKATAIGQLPEEREALERILSHGMVDVGRAFDPANDRLFTWWAPWRNLRQRNIGWRIDYVLASEAVAAKVTRSVVQADVGTSDHAPLVVEIDL
jgi:exodeoxyribonuclease-3